MPKLVSSCLTWLFYFIFSLSWLNFLFGTQGRPRSLQNFCKQEAGDHEARPWEDPSGVLLSFTSWQWTATRWCLEVVSKWDQTSKAGPSLGAKGILAMLRNLNFIVRAYSLEKKTKKRRKSRPTCLTVRSKFHLISLLFLLPDFSVVTSCAEAYVTGYESRMVTCFFQLQVRLQTWGQNVELLDKL